MTPETREPCTQCGRPSNDWMVAAGLVPASHSWCGECKRKFADKLTYKVIKSMVEKGEKTE